MKKIFYYTDVLPFLSREDEALKKLKRNLEIFKGASRDIHVIWHPWSGTEQYLEINKSRIVSEYRKIVEEYCSEGWGDFDVTDTYQAAQEVLFSCDAYYGDPSDLAYEAQNAKLPVMFQSLDV